MKKTTYWMLMALLMVGLGMNFASCKEDELTEEEKEQKAEQEMEVAMEWWDVVSQLTDVKEFPDDWQTATFEPNIGRALESDPYTRIVSTNDLATAAQRFAYLTGAPVDETTADYTWKHEDAGSLTYRAGSTAGTCLAQVDVNLKQMPRLKKILYQTPEQMGENTSGDFSGTAYYRFGDVVRKKNADGVYDYWICVRPAFSLESKGDSHWVCVNNLPQENIFDYSSEKAKNEWFLPTKLGESKEHMQNFAELLYALYNPDQYYANLANPKQKTFHDFGREKFNMYHNKNFWKRVSKAWNREEIYEKVFDGLSPDDINDMIEDEKKGLTFIYKGYSWMVGWTCSLWQANYKNEGNNMHTATYTTTKKDMRTVETFNALLFNSFYEESCQSFFGDSKRRFILRYAKGEELCKDANGKKGSYDVKTKLSFCEDVYVYNKYFYYSSPGHMYELGKQPEQTPEDKKLTHGFFAPGSVIKDNWQHHWICYASWFQGDDPIYEEEKGNSDGYKTRFISFDAVESHERPVASTDNNVTYGIYARNLIPKEELYLLGFALRGAATVAGDLDQSLRNSLLKNLNINISDLVVIRDTLVQTQGGVAKGVLPAFNLAYEDYEAYNAPAVKTPRQLIRRYVTDGTRVAGNRADLPGQNYRHNHFYDYYNVRNAGSGSPLKDLPLDATHSFYWKGRTYGDKTIENLEVPSDRWSRCVREDTNTRDGNFTSKDYYNGQYDWHKFLPGSTPRCYSTYFEPVIFVSYLEIDDDDYSDFLGTYGGNTYELIDDPTAKPVKDVAWVFWQEFNKLPFIFQDEQQLY